MSDDVGPFELPEDAAVQKIIDLLIGMDGMTNCMALGILECTKQIIFQNMNDDDADDWKDRGGT